MSHEGKRPVTVEDLLRLKRAERPAAEFWEQFDRELRAKQLAALVQRRPWWQEVPRVFAGLSRYHLPLGAAAMLAVTFVTVRDFASSSEQLRDGEAVPAGVSSGMAEKPSVASVDAVAVETSSAFVAVEVPRAEDTLAEQTVTAAEAAPATRDSRLMPLLIGGVEAPSGEAATSPAARYIAANLAALEAAEALAVRGLLGNARTFDAQVAATRAVAIEPLQQMTPPSEVRLARYRSPLVATVAEESSDRTGERVARRISGERLYEHIGRIGARGDSVSWKF